MNAKMTAYTYIVQSYNCNSLLIKENGESSYIPDYKTCHYVENMLLFG